MYAKSLAAMALTLLPLNSAMAGEVSYRAESLLLPGEQCSLSIPMPDMSNGPLAGMIVAMRVEAAAVTGVENMGKAPTEAVLFGSFNSDVFANGQFLVGQDGHFLGLCRLDGFDGITDYQGTSGRTVAMVSQSQSNLVELNAHEATELLRANPNDRAIEFTANGGANIAVMGPEDFQSASRSQLTVEIQVTYLFKDPGNKPNQDEKLSCATNPAPGAMRFDPASLRYDLRKEQEVC